MDNRILSAEEAIEFISQKLHGADGAEIAQIANMLSDEGEFVYLGDNLFEIDEDNRPGGVVASSIKQPRDNMVGELPCGCKTIFFPCNKHV